MSTLSTHISAALLASCAAVGVAHADAAGRALAVVMTNDLNANQIKVYDAGGNARGVKQYEGDTVAVVNNGSNSVAVFRRDGSRLRYIRSVTTTSAPVSSGVPINLGVADANGIALMPPAERHDD